MFKCFGQIYKHNTNLLLAENYKCILNVSHAQVVKFPTQWPNQIRQLHFIQCTGHVHWIRTPSVINNHVDLYQVTAEWHHEYWVWINTNGLILFVGVRILLGQMPSDCSHKAGLTGAGKKRFSRFINWNVLYKKIKQHIVIRLTSGWTCKEWQQ